MVEPVRHRQTKGAATDMFDLQPPRHTSTLPTPSRSPGLRQRHAQGGKRNIIHCRLRG